jgi:PAS domain S-box-containing protein
MISYNIAVVYTFINVLITLIVVVKGRKKVVNQFYAFCTGCLVIMGIGAILLPGVKGTIAGEVLSRCIVFLASMLPFFFLHFVVIFVRQHSVPIVKVVLALSYVAGLAFYAASLLGLITLPVSIVGDLDREGIVYYVTWMSVFFVVGIALLGSVISNLPDKIGRPKLLVVGLGILLLALPGPLSGSVLSKLTLDDFNWYFITSTTGLGAAIYLVFRYRIIVNTPYDLLRSALAAMNEILVKTDEEFRIEVARGAVHQLLGYQEKQLLDRSLLEIFLQHEYLLEYRKYVIAHKMGEAFFDAEVVCEDSTAIKMSFSFVPVFVDGQLDGFVGIGQDRRELEELQTRIERMQRIESVGILASGIAHDFNGILMNINVCLATLTNRLKKQESDIPEIDLMKQSAKRAAGIVEKLSTFGRADTLVLRPMDLNNLLRESLALLRHSLKPNIEFETAFCSPSPFVLAHEASINQILFNLVSNARDAMPACGTLSVSTEMVPPHEGGFVNKFIHPDGLVKITVKDTGAGIPAKIQQRIFEPFFTTKPKGLGTGLGLSIVLSNVRNLKGFVEVRSEIGKGTTFEIYLPPVPLAEDPTVCSTDEKVAVMA